MSASDPKRELWLAWWTMVVFYQLFFLVFFVITRTQPPPNPGSDIPTVVAWFGAERDGLLVGFAIVFVITGMTSMCNALIAYSMRPHVDQPGLRLHLPGDLLAERGPGMLLMCLALTAGAMRPTATNCCSGSTISRSSRSPGPWASS